LILNWFEAKGAVSAGPVEGLNNKLKVTFRKASTQRRHQPSIPPGLRDSAITADVDEVLATNLTGASWLRSRRCEPFSDRNAGAGSAPRDRHCGGMMTIESATGLMSCS
jgi:hypothetical protein